MQQTEKNTEQLVRSLMAGSHIEMPFRDFEDNLMQKIQTEQQLRKAGQRERKWASFFFFTGSIVGFTANMFLSSGINSSLSLFLQIIFLALFLLMADKYFPRHIFHRVKKAPGENY